MLVASWVSLLLLLLPFLRPGGPAMAAASKAAFAAAIARLESVGGQRVEVDFSPFAEAAALLYQSSFVAERYSGIRAFLDKPSGGPAAQPEAALQQQRSLNADQRLLPVTRAIISGSGGCCGRGWLTAAMLAGEFAGPIRACLSGS